MPRTAVWDFTDTPPEQGGPRSDRIPPGRYVLRVTDCKDGTTRAGDKQMVTTWFEVAQGDMIGKRLVDRFVRTNPPNNFGWKRLHAFLLALNLPVQQKQVKVDLDRFTGMIVECDVQDEEQAATEEYPARINSVPRAYYVYGSPPAPAQSSANGAAAATVASPATVQAPVAAAPVAAPAEAVAPAPAPVSTAPEAVDAAAADIDDMFK